MQQKEQNILDKIAQINSAIEYEVAHMYINAVGRKASFDKFIKNEAQSALRIYKHSTKWAAIKALISRYDYVDLTTRISIIRQIREILIELRDFYSDNPNELTKMDASKFNDAEINQNTVKPLSYKKAKPKEEPVFDPNLDISEMDIRFVKGVGPALADKLNMLGINTCENLLHHLPRKHISYEDRVLISEMELEQDVTILGEIHKVSAFKSPKKSLVILTIIIKDTSGKVKITKFLRGNSTHIFLKQFKGQYPEGAQVLCSGTVKKDKYSKQPVISNPVIEVISGDFTEGRDNVHTGRIVPIYPLTEGLSLMQLRKIIYGALDLYKKNLKEFLPESLIKEYELMPYAEAIREVHFPTSMEKKDKATERLIFNEFFLMQLRFAKKRSEIKREEKNIEFNCFDNGLVDRFISLLPFKLTYAQERVFFSEILPDLVSKYPMHRLLQGDVGCGKTVVAFLTLLIAVDNGFQGAIMAPTEILAEQHLRSFSAWADALREYDIEKANPKQGILDFEKSIKEKIELKHKPQILEGLGMKVALLTGKMRVKEKREVLQGLANGQINIVIGTHALIQDGVDFNNLGLVIIDEQHRFGVKQRDVLVKKGKDGDEKNVERLFMTATPIPRTLALSMHGDLDVSEIDELPPGRSPAITSIVKRKSDAYTLIRNEVAKGRQAYIVFPLIDESETLSAKAATVEFDRLKKEVFEDFTMGLMHGRLDPDVKEKVMEDFREAKIDILVSTTVIEVGVDVPNATVMMIESAERFGLAQLHQLRGRVGRGQHQSYCLLASASKTDTAMARLNVLTATNNGFVLAQEDMKLRGAGDFLGLRQSGLPDFAIASIVEHEEMLVVARNAARNYMALDPDLNQSEILSKKIANTSNLAHLAGG